MGLTCTFRASCYNARLSWALVLAEISSFVEDRIEGWGRDRRSAIARLDNRGDTVRFYTYIGNGLTVDYFLIFLNDPLITFYLTLISASKI